MNNNEIKVIADAMLEKKGQDVVSLDLKPIGTAISYFATFLFSFSYYKLYKKNKVIPFCGITKPLFISAFSFTVMFLLKNMFNITII